MGGPQARLREALNAGGPGTKDKSPPVADGILSITPDTPEAEEWKNRRSAIDAAAACSSYLDEDDDGPQPSELYGKFTWKIEKFSEISKRELRSTVFEVGSYKWYILVYPQGCDVCNHLSLFLCVADYDKLLPGWSHFAQFTIAVVNKDPKKSKYSDTLHRFCKKEHDWGWKKFMELSKILEGFTVQDTLVIKAQVQVIRDRVARPFRCLDPQYRRELVRVYLTNVEGICRRFLEEKRERLEKIERSSEFKAFWSELSPRAQTKLLMEKAETIYKGLVKRFFNEKEVTSTLVMDALYCGCKQLEEASRLYVKKDPKVQAPLVTIDAERASLSLCGDAVEALQRAACDTLPPMRDEKSADTLAVRSGQDSDEYSKDSVERDERRLAELGRRTVETYSLAHLFFERIEAAFNESECIKRQDALIREEEELERLEDERAQARAAADKEKKLRKKQRQKAKKEADRVKKEAEEAERAKVEEEKREEQERKAREAADKKRKEDEVVRVRAEAAAAELAARARAEKVAAKTKAAKDKAVVKEQQALAAAAAAREQAAVEEAEASAAAAAAAAAAAEIAEISSQARGAPQPGASPTMEPVSSSSRAARWSSSEAEEEEDDEYEGSSLSTDEETRGLREQVRWLSGQLAERNAELSVLRRRVMELSTADPPAPPLTSVSSVQTTGDAGGSDASASRPHSRGESCDDGPNGKGGTAVGASYTHSTDGSEPAPPPLPNGAAAASTGAPPAPPQENGGAYGGGTGGAHPLSAAAAPYRSRSVPLGTGAVEGGAGVPAPPPARPMMHAPTYPNTLPPFMAAMGGAASGGAQDAGRSGAGARMAMPSASGKRTPSPGPGKDPVTAASQAAAAALRAGGHPTIGSIAPGGKVTGGARMPVGNGHAPPPRTSQPSHMLSSLGRQDSKPGTAAAMHCGSGDGKGLPAMPSGSFAGMPPGVPALGGRAGVPMSSPGLPDGGMLSYRNAAVGNVASGLQLGPLPQGGSAVNVSPPQQGGGGGTGPGGAGSSGAGGGANGANGGRALPQHLANGKGPFGSPLLSGVAPRQQHGGLPFTPQGPHAAAAAVAAAKQQRMEVGGAVDSPGLDDFAHMGLITDLLE